MEKHTVVLDLPLELIHKLYGLAIAWNTTVDEVVEIILRKKISELSNESG